jgi:arylsulfatase A-like enzyme
VVRADAAVGELIALLEGRGELDRTAIVVTSDHGESLTEHGSRMSHQYTAYESVLRVPLVVVPPGGAAPVRSHALVQHRDLPATAAGLLGLPDLTEGRSWLTEHPGLNHVASVVHSPSLAMARAMRNRGEGPRPGRGSAVRVAVRDRQWSLVLTPGLDNELYDLTVDRHQIHDLVSEQEWSPPADLVGVADAVVRATSRQEPEALEPDDPDLEALRALGYVE